MNRVKEVQAFLEFDWDKRFVVEPRERFSTVWERLRDVLQAYNPGVIVAAGLGGGEIVKALADERNSSLIVVVEPSPGKVREFRRRFAADENAKRIRFITGDFHDFPVDYYKADLLVCVDCLDIFDSSRSVDEFKRALQFEGILFLATVVLAEEDIDGVYDDFMRRIFTLHNDYYLENDLKTFLDLKGFRFLKGSLLHFPGNLKDEIEYFASYYDRDVRSEADSFLALHRDDMARMYGLNDEYLVKAPYFIGYFMKEKPA